jgi:chemotaxis methyl-accepting protein methylase
MSILSRSEPPPITPVEYEVWRDLIHQRCGLYLPESRIHTLQRRLWRRMGELGIRSYSEYYHFLTFRPEGAKEWERLLESLLVCETGFFRHLPSFQALTDFLLPDLVARRADWNMRDIYMWSAGCATGQEAYSLAMAFLDSIWGKHLLHHLGQPVPPAPAPQAQVALPRRPGHPYGTGSDADRWQPHIIGTDISRVALARAQAGIYRPTEVRFMPAYYRNRYLVRPEADPEEGDATAFRRAPSPFDRAHLCRADTCAAPTGAGRCRQDRQGTDLSSPAAGVGGAGAGRQDPAYYRVRDDVRALVRFGYLNLNDPNSYWVSAQDIIFCQNVLIYFKPENRVEVVRRLCQRLNPGGYLLLAPAEVVGLKLPGVQLVRLPDSLIYQRVQ